MANLGVVRVAHDLVRPSYQGGYARSAGESTRPRDWHGLVFLAVMTLGPSGSTLFDLSGYGNHGTFTQMNPVNWTVDGRDNFGHVIKFDNDLNRILLGSPANLAFVGGDFSSLVWFNMVDATAGTDFFVIKGTTGLNNSSRLAVVTEKLNFTTRTTSTSSLDGATSINDGLWHMGAITRTGSTGVLYLDGVDDTASGSVKGGDITGSSSGWSIGDQAGGDSRAPKANLAQVRIYNRVLPPTEILEIHLDPLGIVRRKRPVFGVDIAVVVAASTFPNQVMVY